MKPWPHQIAQPCLSVLVLLLLLGVVSTPAIVEAGDDCAVTLEKNRVYVGGKRTRIKLESQDLTTRFAGDVDVVSWPMANSEVAFAISAGAPGDAGMTTVDGRLWKAPCDDAKSASLWLESPEVDFGLGIPLDTERIALASTEGVQLLDLSTGTLSPVTVGVDWACDDLNEEAGQHDALSIPIALSDDGVLTIEHGYTCWEHHAEWRGFHTAVSVTPLPNAPVSFDWEYWKAQVAVSMIRLDGDGHLWLSDGPECQLGFAEVGLSRSEDNGDTWKWVTGKAVRAIRFDAHREGHMVVLTSLCEAARQPTSGGELWVSRDGGDKWMEIPRPAVVAGKLAALGATTCEDDEYEDSECEDTALRVDHVELENGKTRHLVVSANGRYFKTRDRGEHWEEVSSMPSSSDAEVWETDTHRFEIVDKVLIRKTLADDTTIEVAHPKVTSSRLERWVRTLSTPTLLIEPYTENLREPFSLTKRACLDCEPEQLTLESWGDFMQLDHALVMFEPSCDGDCCTGSQPNNPAEETDAWVANVCGAWQGDRVWIDAMELVLIGDEE